MLAFGIYLWRNKIDGRVLVGQTGSTKGFLRRKFQYLSDLRSGRYVKKNKHFQRTWNKCGENNFEFIILEILYNYKHLKSYKHFLSIITKLCLVAFAIRVVQQKIRCAEQLSALVLKKIVSKYHLQISVGPNRQYRRRLEINYLIPLNINGKQ
jgi:ABC-type arginine transport system ATPase subunit